MTCATAAGRCDGDLERDHAAERPADDERELARCRARPAAPTGPRPGRAVETAGKRAPYGPPVAGSIEVGPGRAVAAAQQVGARGRRSRSVSSARPGPMSGSHQSPAASAEPVRAWTTTTCGAVPGRRAVVAVRDGQLGQRRPVVERRTARATRSRAGRSPSRGRRGRRGSAGRRRTSTVIRPRRRARRRPALSAVAAASACSRSAMRSSTCSSPTDSRMRSGVTPVEACSSGSSCECVVEAGWMISDFASPTLASSEKIWTLSMSRRPASTPPLTPNVTIAAEAAVQVRLASLCDGCDSRPG